MSATEEKEQMGKKPAVIRQGIPGKWPRILALLAVAIILIAGTVALWNRSNSKPAERDNHETASEPAYGLLTGLSSSTAASKADNGSAEAVKIAKVIRTFSFTLSTKQFEADLSAIQTALKAHDGYVEEAKFSSDRGARRAAYLRVRVPKDAVDAFTFELKGIGWALDVRETAEDVSEQYADIGMRLETQKAKLTRLQEMLKQAVSVEELLLIESSIADTQYQVDSLIGSLKGMDSRVDYATVTIKLKEENQYTAQAKEETLGERLKSAFHAMLNGVKTFAEDTLVFLVTVLPIIPVIAITIIIVKLIYKRRKKK